MSCSRSDVGSRPNPDRTGHVELGRWQAIDVADLGPVCGSHCSSQTTPPNCRIAPHNSIHNSTHTCRLVSMDHTINSEDDDPRAVRGHHEHLAVG